MRDEQRQEIMRSQAASMRAMTKEEMDAAAVAQSDGMRNAWPSADYARGQAA